VDIHVARGEVTVFDDVDSFLAYLEGFARPEAGPAVTDAPR
jgi:hypothetical protein